MNETLPVSLDKSAERKLIICWNDGRQQAIPFRVLRDACQCATCMDEKTKAVEKPAGMLNVISAAEAAPIDITLMQPVGNYAYNIHFSDGHTTGIFTFERLRALTSEPSN